MKIQNQPFYYKNINLIIFFKNIEFAQNLSQTYSKITLKNFYLYFKQ